MQHDSLQRDIAVLFRGQRHFFRRQDIKIVAEPLSRHMRLDDVVDEPALCRRKRIRKLFDIFSLALVYFN